jgi:hypothetical protein
MRPGVDALTLILRRALGRPKFFLRWLEKESPFNFLIELLGKISRKDPAWINAVKLLFCGQFVFLVSKSGQDIDNENTIIGRP